MIAQGNVKNPMEKMNVYGEDRCVNMVWIGVREKIIERGSERES